MIKVLFVFFLVGSCVDLYSMSYWNSFGRGGSKVYQGASAEAGSVSGSGLSLWEGDRLNKRVLLGVGIFAGVATVWWFTSYWRHKKPTKQTRGKPDKASIPETGKKIEPVVTGPISSAPKLLEVPKIAPPENQPLTTFSVPQTLFVSAPRLGTNYSEILHLEISAPVTEEMEKKEEAVYIPKYAGFFEQEGRKGEDRWSMVISKDYDAFMIFDGHGGKNCVNFVKAYLPLNLAKQYQNDKDIERVIRQAFLITNKQYAQYGTYGSDSGSCAVVALKPKYSDEIFIANLGDSRAVMCRDGQAIDLSTDHKPEPGNPEEKRICDLMFAQGMQQQDLRGFDMFSNFIFEQVGGLGTKKHHYNCPYAITRAFGHINENHPYGLKDPKTGAIFKVDDLITATPEIRTQKLTEDDEFILMACDGIWDELSSQDAVTLVRDYLIKNPGDFKGAGALLREAVIKKRPGKDNNLDDITVIIVDLKKMKESGSHAPTS